jgi:hypothetical protein
MPIVQPIVINCPMLQFGGRIVTFDFRARDGGPSVAQASFTEYPHLGTGSGPCTPVELTIHGRPQHPLAGGHFITRVDRLLGIDL